MAEVHILSLALGEARHLPILKRNGKSPSLATLLTWSRTGFQGVKLATHRVGRTICTTEQAIAEFVRRVTEASQSDAKPSPSGVLPATV